MQKFAEKVQEAASASGIAVQPDRTEERTEKVTNSTELQLRGPNRRLRKDDAAAAKQQELDKQAAVKY